MSVVKVGNVIEGNQLSVGFDTPQFHVVPESGFPTDNLRIGAYRYRHDHADVQRRIDRVLEKGELVCIFPEGTLTAHGDMNEFRPGIRKILDRRRTPHSANF